MSLRDEVKYTLIAGAVGLAGILGLGAGVTISQYPLYVPSRNERKIEPKQETKTVYVYQKVPTQSAVQKYIQPMIPPISEPSSLEAICGDKSEPQERAVEARYIPPRVPTDVLRTEVREEPRSSFYNLHRQDAKGVDLFDKLEDVIYRMAHDDRRALRDTYAHLHPLTIQGYGFNPNMHEGPQAREMSRYIVRKMIDNFSCNEQRTLVGIMGQAGYKVNSTDELMTAVSDLYAIFSRNIRDDKDYHAAMLMKQIGAAALIGYGVTHIGKGKKNPPVNPPTPDGIQGGHITGGDRVNSRGN